MFKQLFDKDMVYRGFRVCARVMYGISIKLLVLLTTGLFTESLDQRCRLIRVEN